MTTNRDLTLPVALAAAVPLIALRLGVVYVRMKAKRRRAVRSFRRALLRGGMRREDADRLAAQFESYGRIRSYIPRRGPGRLLPFRF